MEEKFGTTTVGELTHLSRGNIRAALGPKTGDMVWGYIRGADERRIEPSKERKSISAEMNVCRAPFATQTHSARADHGSTVSGSETKSKPRFASRTLLPKCPSG